MNQQADGTGWRALRQYKYNLRKPESKLILPDCSETGLSVIEKARSKTKRFVLSHDIFIGIDIYFFHLNTIFNA
jgi:hypothetical protein